MNKIITVGLLTMAVFAAGCATNLHLEPRAAKGWTSYLDELAIDGQLSALPVPHNYVQRQVSSYDAATGSDAKGCAYAFDGGKVIADIDGPGCITRIWVRDPKGIVGIYVDDMQHAVLAAQFEHLFDGYHEEFPEAIVGDSNGGYYCYIPIPFRNHCRIAVFEETPGELDKLSYQITYAELPKDTPLMSFSLPLNRDGKQFFRDWKTSWNRVPGLRLHDLETEELYPTFRKIMPKSTSQLFYVEEPGTINELEFTVGASDPSTLEDVWISIEFDDADTPQVLVPVAHLFGALKLKGDTARPAAIGCEDDRMWIRYPMPFAKSAKMRIINTTDSALDLSYSLSWMPGEVTSPLYFHARCSASAFAPGDRHSVARITGAGHFVGCSITINGPETALLEGSCEIVADGKQDGICCANGPRDLFNLGENQISAPVVAPTHSLVQCEKSGRTSVHRAFLVDAIPFTSSFAFYLNASEDSDDRDATATSVAYWYQTEPTQDAWTTPVMP